MVAPIFGDCCNVRRDQLSPDYIQQERLLSFDETDEVEKVLHRNCPQKLGHGDDEFLHGNLLTPSTSCGTCTSSRSSTLDRSPLIPLSEASCSFLSARRQDDDDTASVTSMYSSKSHVNKWNEASDTLLIFDWDDTLCPTTYIFNDTRFQFNEKAPCFTKTPNMPAYVVDPAADPAAEPPQTMLELLTEHTKCCSALLRLAASLGKVVIVTLAQEGWVHKTIDNFMPGMKGILKELDIDVVYARASLPRSYLMEAEANELNVCKILKTRSISHVVKGFYRLNGKANKERKVRTSKQRSWKNVLGIGDSNAEKLALQDVLFHHEQFDSRGAMKKCRCKVVRLITEPSLERLTTQLQVMLSWVTQLVQHDADVDLDFNDLDDDMLEVSFGM